MRPFFLLLLCLGFLAENSAAQLKPEKVGVAVFPQPTDNWLMIKSKEGSYIFDGETGEMQGMISHNWDTPAIEIDMDRKEAYLVESFYSRGVRGTREDVLTIVDMSDLTIKGEVDIPDKTATLSFRNHIGLLGDGRHVVIFNMTPAQSVSVVDVIDREFVGEISTPGCAIIMPTGESAFMMICGDGTLQYIRLDQDGAEVARERSKPFFVVDEDPVFDKPMKTRDGWFMISFDGLAFDVTEKDGRMSIGEPWSLLSEEDQAAEWRPGGSQPFAIHRDSQLFYALMHQGGTDTHHENGTEVWVYDLGSRKRVGTLPLGREVSEGGGASHVVASQGGDPKLFVYGNELKLQVYDGRLLRLLRTIDDPGPRTELLQTVVHDD